MSAFSPELPRDPVATEAFGDTWMARRHRLLSGRSVLDAPVAISAWERIALPFGLDMPAETRAGFIASLRAIGDTHIALCGVRDEFPDAQPRVVFSLETFDPQRYFDRTVLGQIDAALFSESERWILVCSPEGFALLAGEPVALEAITEGLGGRDALRAGLDALIAEGEYGVPAIVRARLLTATTIGGSA
jgi:hypothetical protein